MKSKRRAGAFVPVLPDWWPTDTDATAEVLALYADLIGAPDAEEWRKLTERMEEWALTNDVELHPEWGGKSPHRWAYDERTGTIIPNPIYKP
jgi:hypothetical protein